MECGIDFAARDAAYSDFLMRAGAERLLRDRDYDRYAYTRYRSPKEPCEKCGKEERQLVDSKNGKKKLCQKCRDKEDEGCFLTTACTETMGLADDCHQLATLRTYRDHYLARQPGGRRQISLYYDVAPRVVTELAARSDCTAIYERLYHTDIRQTLALIQDGKYEGAHNVYAAMVQRLVVSLCMDDDVQRLISVA